MGGSLAQHEVPIAPLEAECVEGLRDDGLGSAGVRRAHSSPSRQGVVPAVGRAGSPAPEGYDDGAGRPTVRLTERWSVSADGQTLTVVVTATHGTKTVTSRQVFTRRGDEGVGR